MKKILEALDKDDFATDRKEIASAYIFAALAFLAGVGKGQSDVQHLWRGRRVSTRIRSEMMASIYEKALKRKDFDGAVDEKTSSADIKAKKDGGKSVDSKKESDDKAKKGESSASIGKIVQLMSGDASQISDIPAMYLLIVSHSRHCLFPLS